MGHKLKKASKITSVEKLANERRTSDNKARRKAKKEQRKKYWKENKEYQEKQLLKKGLKEAKEGKVTRLKPEEL